MVKRRFFKRDPQGHIVSEHIYIVEADSAKQRVQVNDLLPLPREVGYPLVVSFFEDDQLYGRRFWTLRITIPVDGSPSLEQNDPDRIRGLL